MKNRLFVIVDEKNDVYVNSLISLTQDLAKSQVVNSLKQSIYIFQNTNNINEKARIMSYLANAQDFKLYEICDGESELVLDYKEVLKPYEKILKLTKEMLTKELKNEKKQN